MNITHKAMGLVTFSPLEGAMTQIYLATHGAVKAQDIRGKFYTPVMTWGMRYDYSAEWDVSRALKEGDARKLWEWSESAVRRSLAGVFQR